MKRESVMLAHNYNPRKHITNGWYMSSKLDGMRCIWDGGISRGLDCSEVPYAYIDKHGRYQNVIKATGLWTRYLQPIQAPDWFLDQLPFYPLDGELWAGIGGFQKVLSICKDLTPRPEWRNVQYKLFDLPMLASWLSDGIINVPNMRKEFKGCFNWAIKRLKGSRPLIRNFEDIVDYLAKHHSQNMVVQLVIKNRSDIDDYLNGVVSLGGEGVMLRDPKSVWKPERSHSLLKVKPHLIGEGVCVGYTQGKGKLEGMMGAMVVDWNGVRFELSGFTDEERKMASDLFPTGIIVRFKYRELTIGGLPKEARYYR